MEDLLGVPMSEGTVGNPITRCAAQLGEVEQQIKDALKKSASLHQDETGLRIASKRYWEHVTCTPTLTQYHVDVSRGQPTLQAIGILPGFQGISIHDGWGSYFLYACEHAACIVHLLRDLVALEEQAIPWATELKTLLLLMKDATQEARAVGKSRLDFWEVVDWETEFLRLLDEGDQRHPRAPTPPGQRGRGKPARRTQVPSLMKRLWLRHLSQLLHLQPHRNLLISKLHRLKQAHLLLIQMAGVALFLSRAILPKSQ